MYSKKKKKIVKLNNNKSLTEDEHYNKIKVGIFIQQHVVWRNQNFIVKIDLPQR